MEQKPFEHETTFFVRYADTDAMGLVHHSAYLLWFEEARSSWLRERLGSPRGYALIEEAGYFFAITEAWARYIAPARFGDRVTVRTWCTSFRSRGFTMEYAVHNADTRVLLAEGRTRIIVLNRAGRPTPLPQPWAEKLRSCCVE